MKRIKLTKEEKNIEKALLKGEYKKASEREIKVIRKALAARKSENSPRYSR